MSKSEDPGIPAEVFYPIQWSNPPENRLVRACRATLLLSRGRVKVSAVGVKIHLNLPDFYVDLRPFVKSPAPRVWTVWVVVAGMELDLAEDGDEFAHGVSRVVVSLDEFGSTGAVEVD
jgi:hypothetical protein